MTETTVSLAEAGQLRFLDPAKLRFVKHGASLRLFIENEATYLETAVLRAFPLSEPDTFLSVRCGKDEVGLIRNANQLDKESRALLAEELQMRYFVPVITRIIKVRELFGVVDWRVDTNRGERGFSTRNLRENLTRPSPGRYILTDVDGNRYDIPNLDALDAPSRELLLLQV